MEDHQNIQGVVDIDVKIGCGIENMYIVCLAYQVLHKIV
jgi:hypothetical protein